MTFTRVLAMCVLVAATSSAIVASQTRLTVERLKGLKSSGNDPTGDHFVDTRERLNALIDDFVADTSMVGPTHLYMASSTASRLGRVGDAAFLLYAAQLRRAFDAQRLNISARANGNNAATYLGFLNQTIGTTVNPAVMREPAIFADVIARIEKFELVPSDNAFYPEFAEAKGFKLDQAKWPAAAQAIKEGFLTQFGRRMVALLNDREYFEAFSFVQKVNLGEVSMTAPGTRERMKKSQDAMAAAERRLLPPPAKAPPPGSTSRSVF